MGVVNMNGHFPVLVLLMACLTTRAHSQDLEDIGCIGCHLELDPPYSIPAEVFTIDVHGQAGFTCADCHGGDPEAWDFDEAKDPAKGFIGVPAGREVVTVCSQCHSNPDQMRRYNPSLSTDQEAKYWTSGHGKSMKVGKMESAQCASCHGAHGIRRSSDPGSPVYPTRVAVTCAKCHADKQKMRALNLPSNIVDQYTESVHGVALLIEGDLAAPTCNNCHGNHGAAPPEVGSIQEVCGICHVNNQTLFNQTKMHRAFTAQGLHGCVVCHTAHDIQHIDESVIGTNEGDLCTTCHQPGDAGALQAEGIHTILDSLRSFLQEAAETLQDAESRGMEIEDLLLDFQTAQSNLVQSRTIVHSFNADLVRKEAQPGIVMAGQVIGRVAEIVRDFRWRRVGLGIATILISFLAVVLYLYIRRLDKKNHV